MPNSRPLPSRARWNETASNVACLTGVFTAVQTARNTGSPGRWRVELQFRSPRRWRVEPQCRSRALASGTPVQVASQKVSFTLPKSVLHTPEKCPSSTRSYRGLKEVLLKAFRSRSALTVLRCASEKDRRPRSGRCRSARATASAGRAERPATTTSQRQGKGGNRSGIDAFPTFGLMPKDRIKDAHHQR